jgi:hypothetical protein
LCLAAELLHAFCYQPGIKFIVAIHKILDPWCVL